MNARRKALALFGSALVLAGGAAATRAARARPAEDPAASADIALVIPVKGVTAKDLRDNFHERRGRRVHRALDIMARKGTPVIAACSGRIAKLRNHPLGGICLYQYDEAERYALYYAHLAGYAPGLEEGARVQCGQVIGFVGATGNAPPTAPHLHFALTRLAPGKRWYGGTPVNPYPYLTRPAPA